MTRAPKKHMTTFLFFFFPFLKEKVLHKYEKNRVVEGQEDKMSTWIISEQKKKKKRNRKADRTSIKNE